MQIRHRLSPQVMRTLKLFEREEGQRMPARIWELPRKPQGAKKIYLPTETGIPNGVLILGKNYALIYAVEGRDITAVWLTVRT